VNKALAQQSLKLAFWLACVTVATLSLLPTDDLPTIAMDIWDKAQHATGFLGLGMLGFLAYPRYPTKVMTGLVLLGLAIEVAQAATGWRTGDALDWLADLVGLLIAFLLRYAFRRISADRKASGYSTGQETDRCPRL
jgi:VanZ family protein